MIRVRVRILREPPEQSPYRTRDSYETQRGPCFVTALHLLCSRLKRGSGRAAKGSGWHHVMMLHVTSCWGLPQPPAWTFSIREQARRWLVAERSGTGTIQWYSLISGIRSRYRTRAHTECEAPASCDGRSCGHDRFVTYRLDALE
eukprot:scaffold519104_cov23-Prasinocladus_malaysianus.AAC.1